MKSSARPGPHAGPVERARSLLFVPGNRPDRFDKAAASGADLVVVDLEDAVAPHDKAAARRHVANWVVDHQGAVRVNATTSPEHDADVEVLVGLAGLQGVVVPMADDPAALATLAARLGKDVAVVALVETALGLHRVHEVATAPGVTRLAFGHLDFAADIGSSTDDTAMLMARSTLVVASRAAGLPGPVDGTTTALDDPEAAARDAAGARALGFTGKLCIHPSQVRPVNAAFSPTDDEVAWARRVLEASNAGGVARVDGHMVDAPVLLRATKILALQRDPR